MLRSVLVLAIAFAFTHLAHAQLPADAVMLYKVKVPEKQKSVDLCPVHLVPSNPQLPSWTYKGIEYRGHTAECKAEFEKDPDKHAEAARFKRWENNFAQGLSTIWCPVTDELNPGGLTQWTKLGLVWESCCKFCDEDVQDDDFPIALEALKERAALAYIATGGRYVDDANSPVEGAIRNPTDALESPFLYVATPGVRNNLEFGGHGILVYDVEQDHKFVRRIPFGGVDENGKPLNVKGICASEDTGLLHVSTLKHLICIDLVDDKVLWEKTFDAGCDRMSISPDGSTIYLPSLEQDHWKVIDSITGEELARVSPDSGSHNTVYGSDGEYVYLAGLKSPLLTVAETDGHTADRTIGPFSDSIRPFTVNKDQSLCFVNVNGLLGFEIGDLKTGKMIHRIEVEGFKQGPVKRHGCPSHGIGLTPDEKEIWVTDAANKRLHVFDATVMPPKQVASIELRDEPGWVTFSIDGSFAYPSTGEVVDVESRKVVGQLRDEKGAEVQSEKMLQIIFAGNQPMQAGDQFGIGR
jgi:hypothetical protein